LPTADHCRHAVALVFGVPEEIANTSIDANGRKNLGSVWIAARLVGE
jgi:hypothetical protein